MELPVLPLGFRVCLATLGIATNAVGLDLFCAVGATKPGENFVLSPDSIESALAYAGAAGDTRTEMARVLRLPADDSSLQAGFAGSKIGSNTIRSAVDTTRSRTVGMPSGRSCVVPGLGIVTRRTG